MDQPLVTSDDGSPIWTYDQLIRLRASDDKQTPWVAYPKSRQSVDDFELIPIRELNNFIDHAAAAWVSRGLPSVLDPKFPTGDPSAPAAESVNARYVGYKVVGFLAKTNLTYFVNVFALARLGYVPLCLSTRLSSHAASALLARTGAIALLYHEEDGAPPADIEVPKTMPMVKRSEFDTAEELTPEAAAGLPPLSVSSNPCFQPRLFVMLHSSGSSGLPKPIDYTNRRLLAVSLVYPENTTTIFQTGPLFHAHGLATTVAALTARQISYLWNGHVPQTPETLARALRAARPEILMTVPYVLKLLAEGSEDPATAQSHEGIASLRIPRIVIAGGARIPDELGNRLVHDHGINLCAVFGSTETGQTLNSLGRAPGDFSWNYLRSVPQLRQFVMMKPLPGEPNVLEFVLLDGHRGKTVSNSDDPPNSWYTGDLFEAHATIPDAWRYLGRKDDRVTLLNGEKVLPLEMEGCIRAHSLVKEAVVFGAEREVPGLLLFKAEGAAGMSDEEFLDAIWPTVMEANGRAEAFAQVARDMVVVLPADTEYSVADKLSIKRAQVYREFASVIDAAYARLEDTYQRENGDALLTLDQGQLEDWIIQVLGREHGVKLDSDTDFFAAGVDSLKAVHLRSKILRTINLAGNVAQCPPMIVYDCGTVKKLANRLIAIRDGVEGGSNGAGKDAEIDTMKDWIAKYSTLNVSQPVSSQLPASGPVLVLTGATGSLGANILTEFLTFCPNSKVYCLLRRPQPQTAAATSDVPTSSTNTLPDALTTLTTSLHKKGLSPNLDSVTALYADLAHPTLDLPSSTLTEIRSRATHILHCAWPVNFVLPLQSFEPALRGLHNLMQLAIDCSSPTTRFLFCSSVAAAMGLASTTAQNPAPTPETPLPSLTSCSPNGYGRSKLVAEHAIAAAAERYPGRFVATVFRIGQIVPPVAHADAASKLWNPSEAIPLMIRAAVGPGLGALPRMPQGRDRCRWSAADELGRAMLEIGGVVGGSIEAGSDAGAGEQEGGGQGGKAEFFNMVNPKSFSWTDDLLPALKRAGLEFDVVGWDEWIAKLEASEDDPARNPTKKLLGHYKGSYRATKGVEETILFDTAKGVKRSPSMVEWTRALDGNYVDKLVESWKKFWLRG